MRLPRPRSRVNTCLCSVHYSPRTSVPAPGSRADLPPTSGGSWGGEPPRGGGGGRGATSAAAESMRWAPLLGRYELRPHGPLSSPPGLRPKVPPPPGSPTPLGQSPPPSSSAERSDLGATGEGRVFLLEAGWSCRPRPPPACLLSQGRGWSSGPLAWPVPARLQRGSDGNGGPGLGGSRAPTSADPTSGRSLPLPRPSADRVTCVGRPGFLPRPWSGGPGTAHRDGERSPEPLPATPTCSRRQPCPTLGAWQPGLPPPPRNTSRVTSALRGPLPSLGCQSLLSGSHQGWVPVAWSFCPPPLHPQGGWLVDFRGGQGEPQHPTSPGSSRPLSPSAPPARRRRRRETSFLRFRGEGAQTPQAPSHSSPQGQHHPWAPLTPPP